MTQIKKDEKHWDSGNSKALLEAIQILLDIIGGIDKESDAHGLNSKSEFIAFGSKNRAILGFK